MTFNVNTTADAEDANNFDSACDADLATPGLQCTLRAALEQTNQLSGLDQVNVPAGTYTANSASFGQFVADDDVIVDGAGSGSTILRQTISGRVLLVDSGDSLDLRDVTVRDGVLAANGAGILNAGTLIVRRSVIKNNEAVATSGGGIFSPGNLTIEDSTIGSAVATEANEATSLGAGILASGNVTMRRSRVLGNQFDGTDTFSSGAGMSLANGTVLIERSTISGNGAATTRDSGGLNYTGSGSVTIRDSTISGNRARDLGAGVTVSTDAAASFRNVTVSGNATTQPGSLASGIFVQDAQLALTHATVADNPSPNGAAMRLFTTAASAQSTVSLRATAVDVTSAEAACSVSGPGTETFPSTGFNVITDDSCALSGPGDLVTDPGLRRLADNGGPTRTRGLLPGSPAIDRVASGCPPPTTDQRGLSRPGGPRCDSGAYELTRCGGVPVNRLGTAGNDVLTGTPGPDGFLLFGGGDVARGLGGNDVACGAGGGDRLIGAAGADRLLGQAGNDRLLGGRRRDRLAGGKGRDRLLGGRGRDRLFGGPGRDRLRGGPGRDLLRGGPGHDRERQ